MYELPKIVNPKEPYLASRMYERLRDYIIDFETTLDTDHEVGARLVNFGQTHTISISHIGYANPNIITFSGYDQNDNKVELIQHLSQLSVLLVPVKRHPDRERIGFRLNQEKEESKD